MHHKQGKQSPQNIPHISGEITIDTRTEPGRDLLKLHNSARLAEVLNDEVPT